MRARRAPVGDGKRGVFPAELLRDAHICVSRAPRERKSFSLEYQAVAHSFSAKRGRCRRAGWGVESRNATANVRSDVRASLLRSTQRTTPHPAAPGLGSGGHRPPPGLRLGAGSSPAQLGKIRTAPKMCACPSGAILRQSTLLVAKAPLPCRPCRRYAADRRPRVRGGAIRASAGMFHSWCSFQTILIVRGRFLVRTSDARWREPSRRPRSAWV